ncbi:MAG: hypothetical protein RMM06_04535 [Armatimonadota bacterium]|nr:hypothetical protein [bacterium]MDW8289965.1 hypothetical protein [Armatimonadota bacterium]
MRREVSPTIVIALVAVVVALIVGAYYYLSAPRTPRGVKYTPGVPPWVEQGSSYKPTPDYPPAAPARQ